jgi:uncharacterized SAM-binding protein YcdF (DUF218 family)
VAEKIGFSNPAVSRAATGAALGILIMFALEALGIPELLGPIKFPFLLFAGAVGGIMGFLGVFGVLWGTLLPLAVFLLIVAYTPVVVDPVRRLIKDDPLDPSAIDAVAILSGGVTSDGDMGGQTVDRVLSGIALARRTESKAVIISSESRVTPSGNVESKEDGRRLFRAIAPDVRLYFADSAFSTRTEAVRMKAVADSLGWRQIALVTSPMHTRRACATFEHVGFKVSCSASRSRDIAFRTLRSPRDRLRAFRGLLYESVASLRYREAGWI